MNRLEKYNAALAERAQKHHELAVQAQEKGDERERSIQLMQESMCGDMLQALGRAQQQRPEAGVMQRVLEGAKQEETRMRAKGDLDSADRARVKAETVEWALNMLKGVEKENGEATDAV